MQNAGCRHEKKDPELTLCRTNSVGAIMPGSGKELFYCTNETADCRYALPVGFDYLCRHGDSHAFATEKDR